MLRPRGGWVSHVRASARGQVFGFWGDGSPTGLEVLIVGDGKTTHAYEHTTAGWATPNDAGDRIYTARGIYTNQLKRLDPSRSDPLLNGATIPAVRGPFFVRIGYAFDNARSGAHARVYLEGETQPFATLTGLCIRPANGSDSVRMSESASTGDFT